MGNSYQVNVELVRFDYRGDRDERVVVAAASVKGTADVNVDDLVLRAFGKFKQMVDVERKDTEA